VLTHARHSVSSHYQQGDKSRPSERRIADVSTFRELKVIPDQDTRLVFRTEAHRLPAEQYRMLRRNLMEAFPRGGALLITSAGPQDGKTITSVNLCASFAERGESALLLELDVRQPAVDQVLRCARTGPGIEDALSGEVEMGKVVQALTPFSFCAALVNEIPADPCALVSNTNVQRVLDWARSNFKWTIIDAPPALPASDVSEMLNTVDAAIMVVRARRTAPEMVTRTATLLGERLYGVVLNDALVDLGPYHGYMAAYEPRPVSKPVEVVTALMQ
jgi:capsular exopolysaccharide synthesis family protein